MSLTADVSPFEAPVQIVSALVESLAGDDPGALSREEQDALLAGCRTQRMRDTVRIGQQRLVRGATLRLRNTDSLVRAAQKSGFRVERSERGRIVLSSASGDRLVVSHNTRGSVRIRSTGAAEAIESLVREHTREVAVDYLRKGGLQIQEARLATGEIQILAQGQTSGQPAQVAVQVRKNGTYWADVEKTQGPACADLMHGLVEATGGEVVATDLKAAFHARVVAVRKTRERV